MYFWDYFCFFGGIFVLFGGKNGGAIFVFFGEIFEFFGGKKSGGIFVFFGGIFVFFGGVFNMTQLECGVF